MYPKTGILQVYFSVFPKRSIIYTRKAPAIISPKAAHVMFSEKEGKRRRYFSVTISPLFFVKVARDSFQGQRSAGFVGSEHVALIDPYRVTLLVDQSIINGCTRLPCLDLSLQSKEGVHVLRMNTSQKQLGVGQEILRGAAGQLQGGGTEVFIPGFGNGPPENHVSSVLGQESKPCLALGQNPVGFVPLRKAVFECQSLLLLGDSESQAG